eukprot:scaffold114547_cov69-Phaeocystis_antarctica.AAC.3
MGSVRQGSPDADRVNVVIENPENIRANGVLDTALRGCQFFCVADLLATLLVAPGRKGLPNRVKEQPALRHACVPECTHRLELAVTTQPGELERCARAVTLAGGCAVTRKHHPQRPGPHLRRATGKAAATCSHKAEGELARWFVQLHGLAARHHICNWDGRNHKSSRRPPTYPCASVRRQPPAVCPRRGRDALFALIKRHKVHPIGPTPTNQHAEVMAVRGHG